MYEVRYDNPELRWKSVQIKDYERALHLYETAKHFAENNSLTWVVALWDPDGWLVKSETINPTGIIS